MGLSKQYETEFQKRIQNSVGQVKGWDLIAVFAKSSILDVPVCSEYVPEFSCKWKVLSISLIRSNVQQRIKGSTNGIHVVKSHVESGVIDKKVEYLCCHEVEAVEYFGILWIIGCGIRWYERSHSDSESLKQPVKLFIFSKVGDWSPATLLNLNTCTILRRRYSVPEADLGLPQLLR